MKTSHVRQCPHCKGKLTQLKLTPHMFYCGSCGRWFRHRVEPDTCGLVGWVGDTPKPEVFTPCGRQESLF